MLTVVCVQVENYCGRGAEYVRRLRDGIARHLQTEYRFVCVTDDSCWLPDVASVAPAVRFSGWWQKLALFQPGLFEGRVLYFDLDTMIEGDLARLAAYRGRFGMIADLWSPARMNSGVMAWEAGAGDPVWKATLSTRFSPSSRLGDGDFVWKALRAVGQSPDRLQDVEPGIYSWKAANGMAPSWAPAPPCERVVCCFHGRPRPHETAVWARVV